jgi:hypothetical protein
MREQDILDIALENLKNNIQLEGTYELSSNALYPQIDGNIKFNLNGKDRIFLVQIKTNLNSYEISEDKDVYLNPLLLVGYRINFSTKEKLRKYKISYLDINGNAYLNDGENIIFVENKNKESDYIFTPSRKIWNKIFSKQGAVIIWRLLNNPDLLGKTNAEIGKEMEVDARKISEILKNLQHLKIIDIEMRVFTNYQILAEEWVLNYEYRFKPDKFIGRFSFLNQQKRAEWQSIELNTHKTVWGGEPAAYLLDYRLFPENFTLYTEESRNELIKNYKMVPNPKGEIFVYEKFWKMDSSEKNKAPLHIIYADLFYSESSRCQEEANRLKNAYSLFSNKLEKRIKVIKNVLDQK